MKNFTQTLLAFALIFIFSCANDDGKRNIETYYFPIEKLDPGQVYEYRSANNPLDPPMYWYYRNLKQDGKTYLIGMAYDPEFEPDQLVREERVESGMLLADLFTYEADSTGKKRQIRATIEAENVFPFRVDEEKPGVLLTSIHWRTLADSAKINLVRNRQFEGDTTFTFQGKEVPAIRFRTVELVEHETEGRLPLEFGGEEWYAKGIGLVFLRKNISEEWQMVYELADVYGMEEFEERFRVKLEGEE